MKFFKSCTYISGRYINGNNPVSIKRTFPIHVAKEINDYIRNNLITNAVITIEQDEVIGFKPTPDKPDTKDSFVLEVMPDVYAFTMVIGKKVIPSGYIKNEFNRRIEKFIEDKGLEPTNLQKKDIAEAVKEHANAKAMTKYNDVMFMIDLTHEHDINIIINNVGSPVINHVMVSIEEMLKPLNLNKFTPNDELIVDLKMADQMILKDCIESLEYPIENIKFSDENKSRVLNFSSKIDVLTCDEDRKQIAELLDSPEYCYSKFKYQNVPVGLTTEMVDSSSKYHPACFKLSSFEKCSVIDTEGDVIEEARNEISFECVLIQSFIKNTLEKYESLLELVE